MSQKGEAINPRLEAALLYVRHGWALLPLIPRGKLPCSELLPINPSTGEPGWQPLATSRATLDDVRTWFRRFSDANIGVICGAASGGLIGADFDRTPPTNLHLPITPRVITHRGEHLYFRSTERIKSHDLLYGDEHAGEIKAEGGYVVAPPSVHPSGAVYQWAELLSPTDLDWQLASPPAWVTQGGVAKLRPPDGKQVTNMGYLLTPSPVGIDYLLTHNSDGFVEAVAVILGIDPCKANHGGLGESFRCVLPGHNERHPSASLYRHENGLVTYRDWHRKSGDSNYLLPEVYASQAYGTARKLNAPELTTWHLRLLVETGLVRPADVEMRPLTCKVRPAVRRIYDGFRFLLQCKWVYGYGEPTAFSWRFASAWCGVSERHAGPAIRELLRLNIIRVVGDNRGRGRPMALFLPSVR